MIRSLFIFLALFGVGAGGVAWYYYERAEQPNSFRTVPVERGDMLATISSTATIEPEEVVDVGAQVQGMIKTFGKDPRDANNSIDYGSPVEEGTVLAQIDDSIYKTQVDMAKATLENNIALLAEAKTKLSLSQQNWDRAALRKNNVMTQADYDSAKADLQTQAPAVDAAQGRGRPGQGQPGPITDELALHHDYLSGQRRDHRSPRQHRADGGGQLERSQPVPDRQGLEAAAALGFGQRG